MRSRILLMFYFMLLSTSSVWSQFLEGQVYNHLNEGLQDVAVINLSRSSHSHSLHNGYFKLQPVLTGDTLAFSHLGFETCKYIVQAKDFKNPIQVKLREKKIDLGQIVISNKLKSLKMMTNIDLSLNPVNNAQELMRHMPGLFIGQHAGGGKAEQIFLRGFDIDHGTDINISMDGLPVNMVSHAHGQGYADLHFIIPETIKQIDFDKGPYSAMKGNFATAGYIDFQLKDRLENSSISMEIGQFNHQRTTALIDLTGANERHWAYLAGSYTTTDGAFESPQNFSRLNLLGKYTMNINNNDKISILLSHFTSRWDASGQIPDRAVKAGLINRFGAIDDTEGGQTKRTNVLIEHQKFLNSKTSLNSRFFFTNYQFELYSNFTFFLQNPTLGDQIRQFENRNLFGMESALKKEFQLNNFDLFLRSGLGFRLDQVMDNELSRTQNRKNTLQYLSLGDVLEANMYGFISADLDFGKLLFQPGLRLDYFDFSYEDALDSLYNFQSVNKAIFSPKANLVFSPNAKWQLFAKTGLGFHSNDSRVVVVQNGREVLPSAFGIDVGGIWKPSKKLMLTSTAWYLFLEQEFVYVGDEAIIEPSGRTRRMGLDLGIRYQVGPSLMFNGDLTYTYARSIDDAEGNNLIPLAPDFTATGGINYSDKSFSGALQFRYLDNRPANEDNSIIAKGYFVTDFNFNYSYKKIQLGIEIQNLFNTEWNETQFATESRLRDELESVEEIHFTPGTPFFTKFKIGIKF